MKLIENAIINSESKIFCEDFLNTETKNRFVFGINEYACEIADAIEIAGFVDDYTNAKSKNGIPIIKSYEIPKNAMVVSSLLGRPLTARDRLDDVGARHLDYFSFHTYSGLISHPVRFWGDGKPDIENYLDEYIRIYECLSDQASREIYRDIVNFRISSNINYLDGFCDRQKQQYFEPFLPLKSKDEIFVDVGGFEGETTQEFIRRYPEYQAVYFFEPDESNLLAAKSALQNFKNIKYLQYGASNRVERVRFCSNGSISTITNDGDQTIQLNTLDNLLDLPVSYIKMDIEGAELDAIDGAVETITQSHPTLAIAVYHHSSDLRTIPTRILEIMPDYKLFIRHYTEGVVETIMYFIPEG